MSRPEIQEKEDLRTCRACLLRDLADREAERILSYRDRIPPDLKVSEDCYRKRMAVCRKCKSLLRGTCQECGCYVELRGAARASHCPVGKW